MNPHLHDLKNALIFLENFSVILKGQIADQTDLSELLSIYEEKLKIVKRELERDGR